MDILVIRSISRIVMVLCGITSVIYGIILILSKKEDEEKTQIAHKRGRSYIMCGIVLLVSVVMFIMM